MNKNPLKKSSNSGKKISKITPKIMLKTKKLIKHTSLDEFAITVKKQFDRVDEKFEKVYERFDLIDERLIKMDEKIDTITEKLDLLVSAR